MKYIARTTLVLLFATAIVLPAEYFTKIDLNYQGRIYDLADMEICVIDELENYCLAIINDGEFSLLKLHSFSYTILDTDPREKSYYIVYPASWVPISNLEPYGDILFYDGNAVIFRMAEDNVIFLNMMQVELKKIFFTPMVIKRESYNLAPPPSNPFVDTLIQKMVNEVSTDTLRSFLMILTKNFGNRHSTAVGCTLAARWTYNKFQAYGLDSTYLHYYRSGYAKNTVGIKRGIRFPNWKRYYVICGHIDAVSVGPGADDNGTGTICALEAARVMRNYRFENGIRFITFSGEEQGLLGSAAYASNARSQGDSVLGACNYDMIMYRYCNPETLRLAIGRTRADTLLYNTFKAAVDTYTTQRTLRRGLSMGSSDHASFWTNGYPAFCGIENRYTSNPHYHTSHDSVGAPGYDLTFYTSCVKATIAGLARLAVPIAAGVAEEIIVSKNRFSLFAAYPNPTKGNIRFTISVPVEKIASLKIYNVAGELVREFGHLAAQQLNNLTWNCCGNDGRRLPAGVYIGRLKTAGNELVTKIILIN